jgi:hypothetical protein
MHGERVSRRPRLGRSAGRKDHRLTGPRLTKDRGVGDCCARPARSRRWQLDGLSDEFMVVAWDAPAAGRSAVPPERFSLDGYADLQAGPLRCLPRSPSTDFTGRSSTGRSRARWVVSGSGGVGRGAVAQRRTGRLRGSDPYWGRFRAPRVTPPGEGAPRSRGGLVACRPMAGSRSCARKLHRLARDPPLPGRVTDLVWRRGVTAVGSAGAPLPSGTRELPPRPRVTRRFRRRLREQVAEGAAPRGVVRCEQTRRHEVSRTFRGRPTSSPSAGSGVPAAGARSTRPSTAAGASGRGGSRRRCRDARRRQPSLRGAPPAPAAREARAGGGGGLVRSLRGVPGGDPP